MFKRIDHVVIAVKSLEDSMELYTRVYDLKATPVEDVPEMGIKITKIDVGNAYIELAQPISVEGPIAKFLEVNGEGLYLIAAEVDNLQDTIVDLTNRGARLVGVEEASLSGRVFIHPKTTHGALMMLMEKSGP